MIEPGQHHSRGATKVRLCRVDPAWRAALEAASSELFALLD
jgi:hypothetical protein